MKHKSDDEFRTSRTSSLREDDPNEPECPEKESEATLDKPGAWSVRSSAKADAPYLAIVKGSDRELLDPLQDVMDSSWGHAPTLFSWKLV